MHEISTAVHTAYLDPITGEGALLLPNPHHDVPGLARAVESLHAADWNAMMRRLHVLGWEPSEDESGGLPIHEGTTIEGRDVIGLYGHEPIKGEPSLVEIAATWVELRRLAGLVHPAGLNDA